jgi:hypothetical protein
MKLIKLESEGEPLTESVFSNNINVGYTLPAKCQVALKNISMDFENPTFNIIASGSEKNNVFSFSTKDLLNAHNIELKEGQYSLNELVREIQRKMNNALSSYDNTNPDYCFQWSIGKEINGVNAVLVFTFNRADPITLTTGTTDLNNMSYSSNYFYKSTTDNNKFNASLEGNAFVNNGGFQISVSLDNQTSGSPPNINLSKWIFGIDASKLTFDVDDEDLIIDLMFACVSTNSSGYYTFKKNGDMNTGATPIAVETGDTITINKKDGYINYKITKSGGTSYEYQGNELNNSTVIGLEDIGISQLGYSIHVGNDTGKIAFKNCIMTPNPYSSVSNGVYTLIDPLTIQRVYLDTSTVTVSSSTVSLRFLDRNIRILLGFLSTYYSETLLSGSFRGDTSVSISVLSNDMEVEIIELGNINSYSQTTKQLKGTVAVIPKASLKSAVETSGFQALQLSYDETASWCWLSLENDQPLRIPSLTVRVLSNNKLIPLDGKMSVCLLFKSESEGN